MIKKLIKAAQDARKMAHADYSKFAVGAAVCCEDGTIFSGCNVESSSFGLSICAERVALFKALSENSSKIMQLAVIADTEKPVSPCGACRQIMADYMSPTAKVIMTNLAGAIEEKTVQELIPDSFTKNDFYKGD
ncbi:MAG: cytidine deaminase [Calditrichaeota bacterium]|nr:cytidine deaminase [Calditrichota bacterium]